MSASGSLSSKTRSAVLPTSIVPQRSSCSINSAAFRVAAWRAASGDSPASASSASSSGMPKPGKHCGFMVSVPARMGTPALYMSPTSLTDSSKSKPIHFGNRGPRLGRNLLAITGIPFRSHLSAQIFQSRVIREQRIVDLHSQQSEGGTLPGSILHEPGKQGLGGGFVKRFNDAHVKAYDVFPRVDLFRHRRARRPEQRLLLPHLRNGLIRRRKDSGSMSTVSSILSFVGRRRGTD